MGEVVSLAAAEGSLLVTVSMWRMPDGSVRAVIDDMPTHVIEVEPTISARFVKAAVWTCEGACDLLRQGSRFDQGEGK
jgi:hypothetical protein